MEKIIAVLGAVPAEVEPLIAKLEDARPVELLDTVLTRGRLLGRPVLLGATGIGKVNAALMTSAIVTAFPVEAVWNVGCAGAYRESGLQLGDVLVSDSISMADEGVLTIEKTLSMEAIGIPLLERDGSKIFNRLDLSKDFDSLYLQILLRDGPDSFRVVRGASVTVSMASGDFQIADQRWRRYQAHTEDMESSAVAQVCARARVPVAVCRGVSNLTGDRDKRNWDFRRAIDHSCAVFLRWLETTGQSA